MTQGSLFSKIALRTITIERDAIATLLTRIDTAFDNACELILQCKGRTVVTGMGKSGHIANKIAATLASTGSPAMYMHPAEASHGDIGMITADDVVLAISNSGDTAELVSILPVLKRKGVPLIAFTGSPESILAKTADAHIETRVEEEACPLGLAPTSSTTATLVMGDALAMALLEARGFTREDFAVSHPGGKLGRRLLVKVEDVMHAGAEIPRVSVDTSIAEALLEMSQKGFGMTTVVDESDKLVGVFTDGDLRRVIDAGHEIGTTAIKVAMSRHYKSIDKNALAVEAARSMQDSNVYVLIVSDNEQELAGVVKMHDLLQANVV